MRMMMREKRITNRLTAALSCFSLWHLRRGGGQRPVGELGGTPAPAGSGGAGWGVGGWRGTISRGPLTRRAAFARSVGRPVPPRTRSRGLSAAARFPGPRPRRLAEHPVYFNTYTFSIQRLPERGRNAVVKRKIFIHALVPSNRDHPTASPLPFPVPLHKRGAPSDNLIRFSKSLQGLLQSV